MSVLTTSQLTFCDLRDSYNIHIDAEYIGLTCDNNGSVIDQTDITIQYYASIGTDRIGASCSISNLPDGVSVSTTPSTKTTNGIIVFSVSKGAKLSDDFTSSAKATFITSDSEQFTFEKYITFIKSIKGNAAINFQIYSVNGFEFSDTITSIELKTVAIKDGSTITSGLTYQWKYWDVENNRYNEIAGVTSSSLTISINDVYAFSSIKCEMTYEGVTYEDYFSLTQKTSVYTSIVKFLDGNNIITNQEDYLIAYVELYKDNNIEDRLLSDKVYWSTNNVIADTIITTDITGSYSNNDMVYFVCKQIVEQTIEYNVVLGKYSSAKWSVVEDNNYIYKNDLFTTTTSPVLFIPKEKISKSLTINFEICNKNNVTISRTNAMVFDFNDPIVGQEPAEQDRKDGMLWLDPDTNTLKIWNGSEWVNSNHQNGNVIYTSKPINGYSKGDLWILADGEICDTSQVYLDTTSISQFFDVDTKTDITGWSYSDYESGGLKLVPNNFGQHSTTSTITLTALCNLKNVNISGAYYTEQNYDKISCTVAGSTKLNQVSGNSDYTSRWTGNLSNGQKIVLKFVKNGSKDADNEITTYFTISCDNIINTDGLTYGPCSMLKATTTSSTFNECHWVDANKENTSVINDIKQYFTFNATTGLKIGQSNDQFYVNISSTEMGFYDSKQKVVSISNQSATIKNAKLKENTDFYGQINICDPTSNPDDNTSDVKFIFKMEGDGSFSLALAN